MRTMGTDTENGWGTVATWFAPQELLRYCITLGIALAVAYGGYQVQQSQVLQRLQTVEVKAQRIEETAVREKDLQLVLKNLDEIKQDIRELRSELRSGGTR